MGTRIIKYGQETETLTSGKNKKLRAYKAFLGAVAQAPLVALMIYSANPDSSTPNDFEPTEPTAQDAQPNLPIRVEFDQHAVLKPTPPELESSIDLNQLQQDFYFDENGNERGSFEFAYARLKETAPDRHQWAYDIAEHARDVGVHPLPLMLILTKEVGLNEDYTIGTKDAQGPFQMQALWFIEKVQKYAEDTPFYQNLTPNNPDRIAIDSILNNASLADNEVRKAEADQIASLFANQDKTSDPVAWAFSELRFNGEFVAQIMGNVVKNDFPELAIENLPDNANDAADLIMDRTTRYYATHMTGRAGSDYIWYLSENHPDVTYDQTNVISGIIQTLNEEDSSLWPKVKPTTLVAILESNPGAFPDQANTVAGNATKTFEMYVERQTAMVMGPLQPIIDVTSPTNGQSFDDFKLAVLNGSKNPDILDLLNQNTILTSSLRPSARPFELIATEVAPTVVLESPRPKARSHNIQVSYNLP